VALTDRDIMAALHLAAKIPCVGYTPFYLCNDHRAVAAALAQARLEGVAEGLEKASKLCEGLPDGIDCTTAIDNELERIRAAAVNVGVRGASGSKPRPPEVKDGQDG
jgi:hypothetical protein